LPLIQAHDFFKESLKNNFGLEQITMLPNGNLKAPTSETMYYMGRAQLFSTRLEGQNTGLSIDADGNVAFIYQDDSSTLWQQIIFPAAADPDALYALLKDNASNTVTLKEGHATLNIFEGTTKRAYHGRFDFAVSKAAPPASDKVQVVVIEDKNGDGYQDYRIIYPNGDRQILFKISEF